jgi:putative nucleotidyltransferase with HDIG domain
MDRETAWGIVVEHVKDPSLRRHMVAVESAMGWYARHLDQDPGPWELAGLLHDFDWEIHPTSEQHPTEGAPILRQRGLDEEVVQAILSHNPEGSGIHPRTPMELALMACDEITGLIIAAALVRPHKDLRQLKVKSIKRNWKDRHFTAAVDRDEVAAAVEAFSRECFDGKLGLWEHAGNVLTAMQERAGELGLDGSLAS